MSSTKWKDPYYWEENKNISLKKERWIDFYDIVEIIASWWLIDITAHPNQKDYPHQQIMIIAHNDYIYYIPFVIQDDGSYFLKTIIPSRKYTKQYLAS